MGGYADELARPMSEYVEVNFVSVERGAGFPGGRPEIRVCDSRSAGDE